MGGIDTVVVDSLKALDPKRPIREADIFDALTADRPDRTAMPVSQALKTMTDMLGTAIDPECFKALQKGLDKVEADLAA